MDRGEKHLSRGRCATRVLYNLVFFALLMIASAVIVGQISMDIETIVHDQSGTERHFR